MYTKKKVFYKKQPTGLTALQKKAVTTIARKTTMSIAETKQSISSFQITLFDDLIYAQNLNFHIAQGSNSEQIEGEKMFLQNIHIRGLIQNINNATSNAGSFIRLMLIRTKKPLTSTSTSITGTDVYSTSVSQPSTRGIPDFKKIDLLFDKTYTFTQPNQVNISESKQVDIKVPVNRTHYFEQDNSGYFKDKNYYLIMSSNKHVGSSANSGFINCQYTLDFKDV